MLILELLKTIPFFATLTEEENKKVIENIRLHYFPPNHVIFKEGEVGNEMYIIRYGKVKVYKQDGDFEHSLNVLGEQDFFGEMSLISDQPRNASIKTTEECEVFSISRDDLYDLLEKKPEIAETIKSRFLERSEANKQKQIS